MQLLKALYIEKRDLYLAFFATFGFIAFIPLFTYFYFAQTIKDPQAIMNNNDTGITFYDRNNEVFFTFHQARTITYAPISEIPLILQQAVVASEDKDFHKHPGFSVRAIVRSFIDNIRSQEIAYGGSTITQQLVKNALLTPEKSFLRKYQEITLASEIDRRYTKLQILEMYLNSAYFGEGAFGIEQASARYFSKKAADLTLDEAALLVAVLPAPSRLSPISGDLEAALRRQETVLEKMAVQGYITDAEKNAAINKQTRLNPSSTEVNNYAPHFALMVKKQLDEQFGEERISRSGFHVYTTLDLKWQKYAEQVVDAQVTRLASNNVSNGAAVAIDAKTGEIRALVGSHDWSSTENGKVNLATAPRQPGSAFKPIVYVKGFEDSVITTATILKDQPITINTPQGPYKPQNYDRRFRGNVFVRKALANSLNIPAIEVIQKVGIPPSLEMAKRLGITTLKDASNYGPSLVLGAGEVPLLELTGAYATFANEGMYNEPVSILQIKDKRDRIIFTHKQDPQKALDEQFAFLISSILSDSRARAETFGNALTISRTAAVKTGTTENYKDAWTIGYTPSIAVGVWVGNNDNEPMDTIAGSLGAAPIWRSLMEYFLQGTAIERFTPPVGIVMRYICEQSGLLTKNTGTSSAHLEFFARGTEPTRYCLGDTEPPSASPTKPDESEEPEEPDEEETPTPTPEQQDEEDNPTPSPIIQIQITP